MTTTAQTAHADQLATDLRARRCCDAFKPCDSCRVARLTVAVIRRLESVPARPVASLPSQRVMLDESAKETR